MQKLEEIASKLTPANVKELEDFAAFLLSRQPPPVTVVRDGKEYLNPASIAVAAEMLAGLAPDKTSVELQHEALAARAEEG